MSRSIPPLLPKLPRTFQAVLMGLGLGFAASLVTGWGIYVVGFFLFGLWHISSFLTKPPGFMDILAMVGGIFVWGLLLALVTFIPAIIGGGLIGLFSDRLASFRQLNKPAVVIVGALVGVAVGLYTATFLLPPDTESIFFPTGNPLWMGTVGGLVGIAHSWILTRWLERRVTDPGDETGLIGLHQRKIVGFIAGGIATGLMVVTVGEGKLYDLVRLPVWAAGIAVLGGLLVSWILGIWLKTRMK